MIVGNTEVLRVPANIGLVFLISGILGNGGIGKGLPLAVDLNRNGMFVQNLIQRFLLLRCRWLRFLNMQPFHDHIVRQIVLITRIDRYRLSGIGSMRKAVLFQFIQSAQNSGGILPVHPQSGVKLVVDIDFKTTGGNKIICGVSGLQLHRFRCANISSCQIMGDLSVILAVMEVLGDNCFFCGIQQTTGSGQYLPQIRIKRLEYQMIEIILRGCFIWECRHSSIAACIIVVNRLIPNGKGILRVGKCVAGDRNRKSRLRRFFLSSKLLCIGHHPLDKWVIIQLLSINHLTVYDTALCQGLPNGNRVYIIQGTLLGLGIEAVLLNQLSNATLYLRPRQLHFLRASGSDNKQALVVAAAIRMAQPCSGILFPRMILHVTDNRVFALNITVPCTNGIVNIILREWSQKLM